MLFNVSRQKVTTTTSLPLCCLLFAVKKNQERINLVHFPNAEEGFCSRNHIRTSHNTRQYFSLIPRSIQNRWIEVTVIYTGQSLKLNAFRLGLKIYDISFYRRLTRDSSRFDYSALRESILFLTSYFKVFKWWLVAKWNKSFSFSIVNYGSSRQRGRSCYFQVLK